VLQYITLYGISHVQVGKLDMVVPRTRGCPSSAFRVYAVCRKLYTRMLPNTRGFMTGSCKFPLKSCERLNGWCIHPLTVAELRLVASADLQWQAPSPQRTKKLWLSMRRFSAVTTFYRKNDHVTYVPIRATNERPNDMTTRRKILNTQWKGKNRHCACIHIQHTQLIVISIVNTINIVSILASCFILIYYVITLHYSLIIVWYSIVQCTMVKHKHRIISRHSIYICICRYNHPEANRLCSNIFPF
jgi:hypothetical protein